MANKSLLEVELSKDLKPTVINQKLNDLVKEVKKITTRKSVVISVKLNEIN
jgi:hypothetical protein